MKSKKGSLMVIFNKRLFHLVHCKSLSPTSLQKILKHDPTLSDLYHQSYQNLQQRMQLNTTKMKKFIQEFESVDIDELHRLYKSHNIFYMTYQDPHYPPLLKEIYNPPFILFMMGHSALLSMHSIACVGARDADKYGYQALEQLLPPLIDVHFAIVSGLAKGIDTFAHKRTIEFGGKTIAVIGGGFFHLYPEENRDLAAQIVKDHLLLSEYPPIWKPEKWHFPMRNRIISGLSKGTIVIQAKRRSGSLITADFALEEGREVFAVPGPIHHPLSEGTNHLIQQGAKLVTSGQDILDELITG